MSYKLATLIAGSMLAIMSSTLPASAILANKINQPHINYQQETLLLAAKGKTVEGGHSTGKSPSKKGKHEKGEARRNQDQNVNPAFKAYKTKGGNLSKTAWEKAGMPKK